MKSEKYSGYGMKTTTLNTALNLPLFNPTLTFMYILALHK